MCFCCSAFAQLKWKNVDSAYGTLPNGMHVYKTTDPLDGFPNIAYYVSIDLKNKNIVAETDTTKGRKLTPAQFYQRDSLPVIVMNCSFFDLKTFNNLNVVVNNGKLLALNEHNFPLGGKDTFMYNHPFRSALGIRKNRTMDVAWTFTDSSFKKIWAIQQPVNALKDSNNHIGKNELKNIPLKKWKVLTSFGGGPVLVQNGEVMITNNEERRWAGKAINEKHPRTAAGYTADGKLLLLVIQGRFDKVADGATLTQEANIFKDLGAVEALNLDGGGSSCLLVNGKETIKPSDKAGEQRAVPAVFLVKVKSH